MALISHLYRLSVSYLDLLGRKRQYIQRKTKAGPFFLRLHLPSRPSIAFFIIIKGRRSRYKAAGRQAGSGSEYIILYFIFIFLQS